MSEKMIPIEQAFAEWRKDPDYVKACNALEDEFSLAAAMIKARAGAKLARESSSANIGTRRRR